MQYVYVALEPCVSIFQRYSYSKLGKLEGELMWRSEFYVDFNEMWTMCASQVCRQKWPKEGVLYCSVML